MTATHRALVRRAPDHTGRTLVDVAQVPTPTLADGDLLVAPVVAGICGTDWQILRGERPDPSRILGHEGVARVVAGDGTLQVGGLVTVNPTHPTDPGFLLGHNVPGMWSERTVVPAAAVNAGLVLPVPEPLADPTLVGSLAEPLASTMYGLEIARSIARPRSLVVWGDGIVGRLAAMLWTRELPGLRVLRVSRTDASDPVLPARLRDLPGPVAAVLATPRSGTADALTLIDRHVDTELLVDVHGGIRAGLLPLRSGAVDAAVIRAANCSGMPHIPVHVSLPRPNCAPLHLYGHRGVADRHLLAAVDLLVGAPSEFAPVLTHVVDLDGAADLINAVLERGTRTHGERRVLKSAIIVDGISP
ncbi:alcohol dehydrogenase catalytic domain-containing protein [Tsukamurella ocularis]|uniref:alcohol dehydrogenase catalytic domain-containing protein n=1 Tax=Tsukamurella ocularis TaxID=1970234 RepID=UPI0021679E05|nr:alcohol dehydrogenase catalytic domain-containing protein [Tsukamurella ocularis]MCS3780017.1 hypothetical protein [Tsukamurella ocularis]MCS3788583.1 hypothetical protein [Tsukamurella ocularis]MCS3849793.1 hypothetical protein [Tsukamurella ocularis]